MSGPQQRLVNKQFNSPIGLYSEQNIKEVLDRESQMLANGAVGINFHNPSAMTKPANLHNSAVLRMLEEEESRQRNGQSPGVKRVAWPPPKDEEEEGDFEEQEAIQAQGGAQFSSKTPGLLSTSQTTPFNNHQQAPVVAQTYQPNKPQVYQPNKPNQSFGSSPQPATEAKQSVGSPISKEANWTTYLPDQLIASPQPKPLPPVWAPTYKPNQSVPVEQFAGSPQPASSPQQPTFAPKQSPASPQTNPQQPSWAPKQSPASPKIKPQQPTWAPKQSIASPQPFSKEPNWTTYLPDQIVGSPQPKTQQPAWAPAAQQPKSPVSFRQEYTIPIQIESRVQPSNKPNQDTIPVQPSAGSNQPSTGSPANSPQAKPQQPTWAPKQSVASPQPFSKEPNWTTYLPDQIVGSPQPNTKQPAWAPQSPVSFRQEYTIPIQIESRVQPTNKPNQFNQDTIPVQPSAGPQGQAQQPQPQYKPAPVKQVEPPPSIITLRPTVPISQAPAPVFTSQPATATLRGGKNLRGDMKWPPEDVKEKMDAENQARVELAKGPAVRPRKVHKDYSGFFAQHALNSTYPGYKVPPGTQYYEHHPVM